MKTMREQAIERFICVDRLHRTVFDCAAGKLGMHRGQHMALVCLSHMPDSPSQAEIASKLGISPPAAAGIMNRLEESGHIARKPDENDRRRIVIEITDKGRSVLENTRSLFTAVDMAMFEGMDDEMLTELVRYLTIMGENLKKIQLKEGNDL